MFTFFSNRGKLHKWAFVFTVNTQNTGGSNNDQFQIPLLQNASYNAIVKSPGLASDVSLNGTGAAINLAGSGLLTFDSAGTHTVEIHPNILNGLNNFGFFGGVVAPNHSLHPLDYRKFITLEQWGALRIHWTGSSVSGGFYNCSNLTRVNATDTMLRTIIPKRTFYLAINLEYIANLGSIIAFENDVNFDQMFAHARKLNQSFDNFRPDRYFSPSTRYSYKRLFDGATLFNGTVKGLVNARCTNTQLMFWSTAFNHPLEGWDSSNVTNSSAMFQNASNFDQSLANLSFKSLTSAYSMLDGTTLSTANMARTLQSMGRQGRNVSGNEGLQSNVNMHLGNGKVPPSGPIKDDFDYVTTTKNWTITHGGFANHQLKFKVDTRITGETTDLRFQLPIISTETSYNCEITIDSGTTTIQGSGSTFQNEYVQFLSPPGIKDVTITALGANASTDPLNFDFTKCADDIKKLKSFTHFGNFVAKGTSVFNGAENLETPTGIDSWPYLPQESTESSYWTGTDVTASAIDTYDRYEFS